MKRTALLITTLLATISTGAAAQQSSGGTGVGANTGSPTTGDIQDRTSAGDTDADRTGISTGSNRDDGLFEVYDTNRDGAIDEDEARTGGITRDYETMDENGDRGVSRDEYDTWQQGRP